MDSNSVVMTVISDLRADQAADEAIAFGFDFHLGFFCFDLFVFLDGGFPGLPFSLKRTLTGHSRSAAETAEGKWHGYD